MESISRNFGDLTPTERQVYEKVLGHQLHAGQQIVVQLIDVAPCDVESNGKTATTPQPNRDDKSQLPEWCSVYRGLSDKEVDAVEDSILARSPGSRNIDVDF